MSSDLASQIVAVVGNLIFIFFVLWFTPGLLALVLRKAPEGADEFFRWVRRRVNPRSALLERTSFYLQCAVGVSFFALFILGVDKKAGKPVCGTADFASAIRDFLIFTFVTVIVLAIAAAVVQRKAERYLKGLFPKEYGEILYKLRKVKPVWDWVVYQSYSLLWLNRVPGLGTVVKDLDKSVRLVKHRRWQVFLRCLFAFSIFTLPVELFPPIDCLVGGGAQWVAKTIGADALARGIVMRPWMARFWEAFWNGLGGIYILLFDWLLTVLFLWLVVSVLSLLEPENLFDDVAGALEHFVPEQLTPFLFAGYFWQREPGQYGETLWPSNGPSVGPPWEAVLRSLQTETLELDKCLPPTWQGGNSRVSAVFEDASTPVATTYRVHYRRFGRSAYLTAVGVDPARSAPPKPEGYKAEADAAERSQKDFLLLSESIGCLVNVRHSLKQGGPQLVTRIPK